MAMRATMRRSTAAGDISVRSPKYGLAVPESAATISALRASAAASLPATSSSIRPTRAAVLST
jgi:hypothetical protein